MFEWWSKLVMGPSVKILPKLVLGRGTVRR